MRFYDAYEYEIDTNLCKTEQRLKDLFFIKIWIVKFINIFVIFHATGTLILF